VDEWPIRTVMIAAAPSQPFADNIVDVGPSDGEIPEEPFLDECVDLADAEPEPIEFSWSEPADAFDLDWSPPESKSPPEPSGVDARARSQPEPGAVAAPTIEVPSLPVYGSPLAAVASPLAATASPSPARVEAPVPVAAPALEPGKPGLEPAVEAAPAPERLRVPASRRAAAGTAAVVVAAAAAAGVSNLIGRDDAEPGAARPRPSRRSAPRTSRASRSGTRPSAPAPRSCASRSASSPERSPACGASAPCPAR